MTRVLFAHRDFAYFVPKLRERFPDLEIVTAPDLLEADDKLADVEVLRPHHDDSGRIENGMLICNVGVATVRPAEFVYLRFCWLCNN